MIVPDAVVNAILPAETVKLSFTVKVPLTTVVYVELPRFTEFVFGVDKFVPVPIFIPPVIVESDPIIIGPDVRVAVADPPIYSAPVVCELPNFKIPVVPFVALLIFEASNPTLQR